MRVMIDTNILISAVLFPGGKAAYALQKALVEPFEPIICDYVLNEFKEKFREKFSDYKSCMENFLDILIMHVEVVETPKKVDKDESFIRDQKDRPILRAALNAHAELLLTGDKDFLESEIVKPYIISVNEFIKL